ncbi:MAG: permease prefix domain 1-containing protein [Microthrixaceae bacterium]|nr:permease prefix domain 1-containing protein [Microthrixaceae bacterium]
MASYELIEQYVDRLRRDISWRQDGDAIVDEVADHLTTAVEHRVAAGTSAEVAQGEVLERFGDSGDLALEFATTRRGGVALPTQETRTAGAFAFVSAVLWVAATVGWVGAAALDKASGSWDTPEVVLFGVATLSLVAATATFVITMYGIGRRVGGLGVLGVVAVAIASLGVLASVMSWFLIGWQIPLAIGTALFAILVARTSIAPRLPIILMGSAWPSGLLVWGGLRLQEVGTPDQWGDYWIASGLGGLVGVTLTVAAMVTLGRWLTGEEAVLTSPLDVRQSTMQG